LHGYNNPVKYVDPTGHVAQKPCADDGLWCGETGATAGVKENDSNIGPVEADACWVTKTCADGSWNDDLEDEVQEKQDFVEEKRKGKQGSTPDNYLIYQTPIDPARAEDLALLGDIIQGFATLFSVAGSALEIASCAGGAGLVGWMDWYMPVADASGCVAGVTAVSPISNGIAGTASTGFNILSTAATLLGEVYSGASSVTISTSGKIDIVIGPETQEMAFVTFATAGSPYASADLMINLVASGVSLGVVDPVWREEVGSASFSFQLPEFVLSLITP
ncbi:MAG: hypothetical protein OEZ02_13640, partial [Anaerolineae bacterium]|nr:hypothetical protein [Anaerolineae bacterium]